MIKDKRTQIAALFAKASAKGVTKEESEALTAKAVQLMNKYQIEDAEIRGIDPGAQARARIETKDFFVSNKAGRADFRKDAIRYVVSAYAARMVQTKFRDGSYKLTLVATVSTLDMLGMLIPSLLEQIEYHVNKASRQYVREQKRIFADTSYIYSQAARFRKDYTTYYGIGVAEIIENAKSAEAAKAGALVLVEDKKRVDEEFGNLFGDLRRTRKKRAQRVNPDGALAGFQAGKKANLVGTPVL